ncbi:hypothetical protein [Asaia bogorensis]|uniref:hypothetical protein n=1 Tax=Asaia bogorensis TaxID=91915 RepID=UPI0013C407CF|nr:hypothetical protein [Asaia bogorensis]
MLATLCLILRGAFPAQAAGAQLTGCGVMTVQSTHAGCAMHNPSVAMNGMGQRSAAAKGTIGKAEQPQYKPHGEGCHGCPPSLSCTTGHVALGATSPARPLAVQVTRYAASPGFALAGQRRVPDPRPPRFS